MFNRSAFLNSRPGGVAVLEIVPPHGGDAQPLFVPLKRTELRGEVVGPLAALEVAHVYGYTRQQCGEVLEALYRFPLPGDAAVTGVTVHFGDVEIRAELRERQQAEKEYGEAKSEGRQAALLTRESPDVFTLQITGLQPGQDVRVVTSYVQLAQAAGVGWSLRVPLTTAPRYVRSDELDTPHAHGQPLALLRDPGHRFTMELRIVGAADVQSSTHRLAFSLDGEAAIVALAEGEVVPDRDCLLTWTPRQQEARPALSVWLHAERETAHTYFLAQVAPPSARGARPAEDALAPAAPREVILLVDHSGSMQGAKWAAADWAVRQFLGGLTPADAFNLGLFHNTTRWFRRGPAPATEELIGQAWEFLAAHRDSGGTELGVALEQALDMAPASGRYTRHVLIVTDAEVTDAGRLLRLAERAWDPKLLQGLPGRRISVLCIDAAPNAALATRLAERGGGVARFLTSAPDEGDITTALDEVLADWAEPAATDLRLSVNAATGRRPAVQAAGRSTAGGEIDLGDLPYGRTIWVIGRLDGAATCRAETADLEWRLAAGKDNELAVWRSRLDAAPSHPQLKALFGAHRALALEDLAHAVYPEAELRAELERLGYDPAQVLGPAGDDRPKVYAENERRRAQEALRALLVREALEFGLATAETAWVAVRTEAGTPAKATVLVGNALPAGWSEHFLMSPGPGHLVARARGPRPLGGIRSFLAEAAPAAGFVDPDDLDLPAFLRRPGPARRAEPPAPASPVFSGVPVFSGGEAVLLDTARPEDERRLPEEGIIVGLRVAFPAGAPQPGAVDPQLEIQLYVDDLSAPRVRVRLADLLRQSGGRPSGGRPSGGRPMNVRRGRGQVVRLILLDPAAAWAGAAPALEVTLSWQDVG